MAHGRVLVMSACRRTGERLTPYVDGMLPASERADIEAHLDDCGPCRRAVQEAAGGRRILRHTSGGLAPALLPPGLRTRCEALAREHIASPRGVRGWASRLMTAATIALLVLATALVVFGMATRRSNVVLAQQLTADHAKCFRWFAPAGGAVDAHLVEDMLAREYGWDVHVPPSSAASGLTLMGARRCLYASGTIPHVMYRVGDEDLSLFVLDGEQRMPAEVETLGHRSKIWSEAGTTYVLVSSGAAESLDDAAQYIMEQEKIR